MTIHDFDSIRPLLPEELPAAFDELLADEQFQGILRQFYPSVPAEAFRVQLYQCKTSLDVQKTFLYPLIKQLLSKVSTGLTMNTDNIPTERRSESFTFISNHRDIVLDSAFLSLLLLENGFRTTTEIAIGDNLLIYPWIRTLVRVNKSFIVQRSLPLRQMLQASKLMSQYMHFAHTEKRENIWIAQREGRAKDANDQTQESVLKMMTLGGEGTPLERLKQLDIVPLTISYEYDPCDYLKAQEFQQRRDNPDFSKSKQDDLNNMQTGIFGYKGKIHYHLAKPINTWIDELVDLQKNEFFKAAAERMDREIYRGYQLFPSNYIALDLLRSNTEQAAYYTPQEREQFEAYLASRIAKVELPQKDTDFLRERLLTMYANPLINYLKAQG